MPARTLWIIAILLSLLAAAYLDYCLFATTPFAQAGRTLFLPGATTQGHHQIELACVACHKPFQGSPQKACLDCHGEALKAVEDSHAVHKFSDPRNVWMLKQVDALHCVACHREHRPDSVRAMDVTVPNDFCIACHGDIAKERPSLRG